MGRFVFSAHGFVFLKFFVEISEKVWGVGDLICFGDWFGATRDAFFHFHGGSSVAMIFLNLVLPYAFGILGSLS